MSSQASFNLTEKVIVITGATGFLGQHFTKSLLAAGATVVACDITDEADINMDVTDRKSIDSALDKVIKEHGRLDVVINNAALDPKFESTAKANNILFPDYPEELLRKSVDVNLLGYVRVAQAAVKQMLKQPEGHIINVSSIYGLNGPDQSIYPEGTQKPVDYAITKGGVIMLTKWLASTYGRQGIRANTISFGGVLNGHDKEFQEKYSKRTALGRMTTPNEVGAPMVFLASPASAGMTGANLIIDGGWSV